MKKKKCNRCKKMLPANPDVFVRDKSRADGLAYECRPCHSARRKGRDNRTDRWALQTPEQREKVKARQRRYNKTPKGRAIFLKKAYQRLDECDFTTDELVTFLEDPCVHCGTTERNRGIDRIDNSRGHTKDNAAPSCAECNFARGDRFSFEEMKLIGKTIQKIMDTRSSEARDAARQENFSS